MSSNLTDAFDMTALKLQAFSYAELISPTIHDGVTIGPASGGGDQRQFSVSQEPAVEEAKHNGDTGFDDSQWDRSQLNQSEHFDTSVESTVQHVVHNLFVGEMEKLRREMISRDMKRRMEEKRRDAHEYRERITAEAAANLEEKSNILRQVYAAKLENALRELREREQRFAEEDSRRLREIAKRREARKDVLKRQVENSKTHQFLDSIRVAQVAIGNCYKQYLKTVSVLDAQTQRVVKERFDGQFQAVFDRNAEIMKSGNVSEVEVKKWHDGQQSVEELLRSVDAQILLEKKRVEVTVAAAASAASAALTPAQIVPLSKAAVRRPETTSRDTSVRAGEPDLSEFISPQAMAIYSDVEQFFNEYEEQFRPLAQDATFKQFKARTKFALVPIISVVCPKNLNDQLSKIITLLSGAPYITANNKKAPPFQASAHPQGIAYCKRLIADLFLNYDQDKYNLSSYASLIVTLTHRYPDLLKLFRWFMYKHFPATVPYNIPQYEDQTSEEYKEKCGLKKDEPLPDHLERVAMKIRLYAAIIVSPPKNGEVNPFGLDEGWRWLVDVINRKPLGLGTALIIRNFLEVAGARLFEVYGRQFTKLVSVLERAYLPECVQMDLEVNGSAGYTTDLQIFIANFRKRCV